MHFIQKKKKIIQNAHMNVCSREDTLQSTRHWRVDCWAMACDDCHKQYTILCFKKDDKISGFLTCMNPRNWSMHIQ
jgi:hypothetical protein